MRVSSIYVATLGLSTVSLALPTSTIIMASLLTLVETVTD